VAEGFGPTAFSDNKVDNKAKPPRSSFRRAGSREDGAVLEDSFD
jgi:hypothetical protein